jgi:hypothetical protein
MTLAQLAKIAHISVFAVWFGTDLATFYLSRRVIDTEIPIPTRTVLARSMMGIEVLARLCLPTMLALGLTLSIEGGQLDVPRGWLAAIWAVWAIWVGAVWLIHRQPGELAGTLATGDLVFRSMVCVVLWIAGVRSAFGDGPFIPQSLGAKVTLFAVIMTCGIAIRFLLRPFGPAFAKLAADGPDPVQEATMSASIRRAQPLVAVIWVSLLLATTLAVVKEVPWS